MKYAEKTPARTPQLLFNREPSGKNKYPRKRTIGVLFPNITIYPIPSRLDVREPAAASVPEMPPILVYT
jgi:hypothetical protein